MELITREINGVRSPIKKRYIEIIFKHDGTTIDCGFLDHNERIELADHLSNVVEDLLDGIKEVES